MRTRRSSSGRSLVCSVPPWVVTADTGAFLDFVAAAFAGVELARVRTADGTIGHGEIKVGDTVVLAFDRRPEWPDRFPGGAIGHDHDLSPRKFLT